MKQRKENIEWVKKRKRMKWWGPGAKKRRGGDIEDECVN